jgi:hypothetical protein
VYPDFLDYAWHICQKLISVDTKNMTENLAMLLTSYTVVNKQNIQNFRLHLNCLEYITKA